MALIQSRWVGVWALSFIGIVASTPAFCWEISKNYAEIQTFMGGVVKQYPNNARLFDVGMSDSGVMIQGLELGQGSVTHLLVATHHGNEYGSTEVAKAVALSVAEKPLNGIRLLLVPVVNISGYNQRMRNEFARGRNWDPNRNYPCPCGTEGPFTLKSTTALDRLMDIQNVVTVATLHTFSPAVVYPWGFSTRDTSTLYDEQFKRLVSAAAAYSQYEVGNSAEVIYPANGTFEDYAFHQYGIWAILFELGGSHRPSLRDVEKMNADNVPGIRKMFEESPTARAADHTFTGRCNDMAKLLDRHDE